MLKKKIKIVIVATVPDTFDSILRGLPKWLDNYYSVSIITSPSMSRGRSEALRNLKVHYIPMERGIAPIRDLISIYKMIHVLNSIKPDIVHSYTPKAGMVGMISSAICKTKVRIHTFTGLVFPTQVGISKRLLMGVDRLICKCATHVVPEGRGVANDLRTNRITDKKLDLIGNGNIAGVDTNYFSPNLRKKYTTLEKRDINFCYIGRLSKDKGLSELISSFASLPDNSKLIIAGSLDERDPILDSEFQFLKNHPRVECHGWLDDIRELLDSCDVFVLPSYREGFPNVLLQAGATAKPVIATDVNGSNEIIVDGVNGWLVPPRDSEALTKAMLKVLHLDKVQLNKMGQFARERVVNNFEQSFYRNQLLEFYREILREANC